MKRRISMFALCLALWLPTGIPAATPAPGLAVDGIPVYRMPPPSSPSAAPSRTAPVTVVYHFSYYCRTCAEIAGQMDQWFASLPADVQKLKVIVPVAGQTRQEPSNASYQAMQQLGVLPQVEPQLFALLGRGNGSLPDRATLLAWLGKAGVSQEAFQKAADSFSVATRTARAQAALLRLMQSDDAGLPAVVIDDRYLVMVSVPREIDRILAAVSKLVMRAQEERKSAATTAP
jgi:hypothetical protein